MKTKSLSVAAAMLGIVMVGGCSSESTSAESQPAVLAPGTAQVGVNGEDVRSTSLHCATVEYLTTLEITNELYRVTAMVSNAENFTVEWVRIDGLNGFTGSYNQGLCGDAKVTMTGPTYHITGDAYGFNVDNPEPVSKTFVVNASC